MNPTNLSDLISEFRETSSVILRWLSPKCHTQVIVAYVAVPDVDVPIIPDITTVTTMETTIDTTTIDTTTMEMATETTDTDITDTDVDVDVDIAIA